MNVQCILAVEDPYKYYVCSVCMCVCVFVCSCVQCVASASTFNISPVLIIFFVFIDFVECKLFDDSLSIALKTKKKTCRRSMCEGMCWQILCGRVDLEVALWQIHRSCASENNELFLA